MVSVRISVWHLTVCFSCLYILLVILVYKHLERDASSRASSGRVFKPRVDDDGNIELYAKECSKIFTPRRKSNHRKFVVQPKDIVNSTIKKLTIQMEEVWPSISVKYPQYVYTSSGWIQVIDVPNYDPKPLQVIIVPHSHQDPGWLETFESYYEMHTRKTLNNIVSNLRQNPTWKFIWSEVIFLERWFNNPASPTEEFKRLVHNGQLEIVTGGWVMTDEAVTHYTSMLDQLIEGHTWLKQHLGVSPNVSWSVDPFGHSPTMAYLLGQAGIRRMVIQRVHFGIKRYLAQKQQLEFMWRQAWDTDSKTDVLCHMMPFLLYAIHYSCGPDPHVCCQFDFYRKQCQLGGKRKPVVSVTDENIRKLSWSLWEQLQKKSQLYHSNVLLVPHGDDFRYRSQAEWDQQLGNLGKLMEYMNHDADMNTQIKFGTISDYFNTLEAESSKSHLSFPSLSGDFLPYNDRDDQYWTGFYSTRPWHKHLTRLLQAKLRLSEILMSITVARPLLAPYFHNWSKTIVSARRTQGLLQHHDAITGTSRPYVMKDYARKLLTAVEDINKLLADLSLFWVAGPTLGFEAVKQQNAAAMWDAWPYTGSSINVGHTSEALYVTVSNPDTIAVASSVTVRTTTPGAVADLSGKFIPSQCNPVLDANLRLVVHAYDIMFVADVPPLSMRTYKIVTESTDAVFATVKLFGEKLQPSAFRSEFRASKSNKPIIEIENNVFRASFSSCTGTLQSTFDKRDQSVFQTEVKIMTYGTGSWSNPFRDSSGAYIFMPRGYAQDVEVFYPSIVVMEGPVASTVMSLLPGVRHSVTLYNNEGPMGAGIHIDNIVDISSDKWDNKELVMRVETDVLPPQSDWCVDLNGFQMHRKKYRPKFLIQGNFHPMTTMAFIEDEHMSRISLLTSHSHGASTQSQGWLEVILDRRLMQDDWRGLNQGVKDNQPVPSKFILVPERGAGHSQAGPVCQPSPLAHMLSCVLNNPLQVAVLTGSWHPTDLQETTGLMDSSDAWPSDFSLLNLRHLEAENYPPQALMVLHKTALDCNFPHKEIKCGKQKSVNLTSIGRPVGVGIKSATETSLTGTVEYSTSPGKSFVASLDSMEIKTFKVTLGPR